PARAPHSRGASRESAGDRPRRGVSPGGRVGLHHRGRAHDLGRISPLGASLIRTPRISLRGRQCKYLSLIPILQTVRLDAPLEDISLARKALVRASIPKTWVLRNPAAPELAHRFAADLSLSHTFASLLANRGFMNTEEIQEFLHPKLTML